MFYCLLASRCAGGGRRNSQITRYSFLPAIAGRWWVSINLLLQSIITFHPGRLPLACYLEQTSVLCFSWRLERSRGAIFRASPPPSTVFTHESTVWFEEKCFHLKHFQSQLPECDIISHCNSSSTPAAPAAVPYLGSAGHGKMSGSWAAFSA